MESAPQVWYDSQGRLRSGARPQGVASHPVPLQHSPAPPPAVLHPLEQYPTAAMPQPGYSYNPATVQVQVFSQSGGTPPQLNGPPQGYASSLPHAAPPAAWEQPPVSQPLPAFPAPSRSQAVPGDGHFAQRHEDERTGKYADQQSAAAPRSHAPSPPARPEPRQADRNHTEHSRPEQNRQAQSDIPLSVNATAARSTPPPDRLAGQYGQYREPLADSSCESQNGAEWHQDPAGYSAPPAWQQSAPHGAPVEYEDRSADQWHHASEYPAEEESGQGYGAHHGYAPGSEQGGYGPSGDDHGAWYGETEYGQEPQPQYESYEAEADFETDTARTGRAGQDAGEAAATELDSTNENNEDQSLVAAPLWFSFSRGVALFLGTLALVNVLGEMRYPGFDGSLWWIDLARLPGSVARGLLAAFAGLALSFGLAGRLPGLVRKAALSITGVLLLISMWSMLDFYQSLRNGLISSTFPVPFSLHVSACFAVLLRGLIVRGAFRGSSGSHLVTMATAGLCLVAFPLCQICCSGNADQRRPADAVVVFGCGVDQQGNPSHALQDRMRTCCELYHAGLARTVVLSGGPGPGMVHETEAMRKLAEQAGIPTEAIQIDRDGFDTLSTVRNFSRLNLQDSGEPVTALMVSHFYHLPRIGLCCRHSGISASTVPARQKYVLRWQAWYIAREIPALWRCWLRPVMGSRREQPSSLAAAETL